MLSGAGMVETKRPADGSLVSVPVLPEAQQILHAGKRLPDVLVYYPAAGDLNTNQMESFNGNTVRLREVAARGLKSEESAIITGLRLYHNFVRSHLGLKGGMTPGEAAGIIIEGKDKWKTMIQAAAKRLSLESGRAYGAQCKARQDKARSPA